MREIKVREAEEEGDWCPLPGERAGKGTEKE